MLKIKGTYKVTSAQLCAFVNELADAASAAARYAHPVDADASLSTISAQRALLLGAIKGAKLPASVEATHEVGK